MCGRREIGKQRLPKRLKIRSNDEETNRNRNQTCDCWKHFVQHFIDLFVRASERTVKPFDLPCVGGHIEDAALRYTASRECNHVAWSGAETCVEGVVSCGEEGLKTSEKNRKKRKEEKIRREKMRDYRKEKGRRKMRRRE
jgi:hypothetical protein